MHSGHPLTSPRGAPYQRLPSWRIYGGNISQLPRCSPFLCTPTLPGCEAERLPEGRGQWTSRREATYSQSQSVAARPWPLPRLTQRGLAFWRSPRNIDCIHMKNSSQRVRTETGIGTSWRVAKPTDKFPYVLHMYTTSTTRGKKLQLRNLETARTWLAQTLPETTEVNLLVMAGGGVEPISANHQKRCAVRPVVHHHLRRDKLSAFHDTGLFPKYTFLQRTDSTEAGNTKPVPTPLVAVMRQPCKGSRSHRKKNASLHFSSHMGLTTTVGAEPVPKIRQSV